MSKIILNGVDYAGGSGGSGDTVSWTQVQQSGTKIAEIDINGASQDVYAPSGGGGGGGGGAVYMGAELLWEGSFSGAGTIDVPNLDQYLVIAVQNDVSVLVIGNAFTGSGALGLYNQASHYSYAYRFNNSVANKLTIDQNNRGIMYNGNTTYAGSSWCTITKIYGLVKKSGADGRGGTTYTTTEQVVGTWLGKPLYQITIAVDNPTKQISGGRYYYQGLYNSNVIDFAQVVSVAVYDAYYSRWYTLPYDRINGNESIEFFATTNASGFALSAHFLTGAPAYDITKLRYTLQYTKTTD